MWTPRPGLGICADEPKALHWQNAVQHPATHDVYNLTDSEGGVLRVRPLGGGGAGGRVPGLEVFERARLRQAAPAACARARMRAHADALAGHARQAGAGAAAPLPGPTSRLRLRQQHAGSALCQPRSVGGHLLGTLPGLRRSARRLRPAPPERLHGVPPRCPRTSRGAVQSRMASGSLCADCAPTVLSSPPPLSSQLSSLSLVWLSVRLKTVPACPAELTSCGGLLPMTPSRQARMGLRGRAAAPGARGPCRPWRPR